MGLVAVVFAVIVFAFSLQQQRGSLGSTLAPDAFGGSNAFASTTNIAGHFPQRPAGSANDNAIADEVAQDLGRDGFRVSTPSFSAPTPEGTRTLENVIAVRSGITAGTIVVVAHRDATGLPRHGRSVRHRCAARPRERPAGRDAQSHARARVDHRIHRGRRRDAADPPAPRPHRRGARAGGHVGDERAPAARGSVVDRRCSSRRPCSATRSPRRFLRRPG